MIESPACKTETVKRYSKIFENDMLRKFGQLLSGMWQ